MKITDFGATVNGDETKLYTLTNCNNMEISVTDYGAALTQVIVPDKEGNLCDVVLGYDEAAEYEAGGLFLGATVGRSANRIGGASIEINGKIYELVKNDNDNNLHSGPDFYHNRVWDVKEAEEDHVTFVLESPDGDQGYPGNLHIEVTYTLTEDNAVKISYYGVSDEDTVINMTNHSYFNMDGHDSGDVLSQKVWIDADQFTPSDATLIPTGEYRDVTGTPFDFRTEKTIGQDIHADDEQIKNGGGYDHNYVLKTDGKFAKVASMTGAKSGIVMDVYTDMPGMQVYTANGTTIECGKNKSSYKPFCGACFETQFFPDSIHHDNFKSCVLKANTKFTTVTEYRFHTV